MLVAAMLIGPDQATVYLILVESIKTSTGIMDPREARKPVRVPELDPPYKVDQWPLLLRDPITSTHAQGSYIVNT